MNGFIKEESGATIIELIGAMVFMVIFGALALAFIQSGRAAGQRIIDGTNSQGDARVAASFINAQIRMNDAIGRVEISRIDGIGRDGILIRHRAAAADFDRWIYFEDGKLLEAITIPYEQPVSELATAIAYIYSFRVSYDKDRGIITAHIGYEHNDAEIQVITITIALRSERTEGIIIL